MNSLVTIKAKASGSDALGQPSGAWQSVASVWADVMHESGIEAIRRGGEASIVKASVKIRSRSDVVAGMRVQAGGADYDIHAILPGNDRRFSMLVCQKVN